MDNQKYKL